MRDVAGAEIAPGASAVVDKHGLAERTRQRLGDQSRDHIGRAAGWKRHDQPDRVGRPRRSRGARGQIGSDSSSAPASVPRIRPRRCSRMRADLSFRIAHRVPSSVRSTCAGVLRPSSTATTACTIGISTPSASARCRIIVALATPSATWPSSARMRASGTPSGEQPADRAVARQIAGRGQHQIAEARQAHEGLGACAEREAQARHLGQARG